MVKPRAYLRNALRKRREVNPKYGNCKKNGETEKTNRTTVLQVKARNKTKKPEWVKLCQTWALQVRKPSKTW